LRCWRGTKGHLFALPARDRSCLLRLLARDQWSPFALRAGDRRLPFCVTGTGPTVTLCVTGTRPKVASCVTGANNDPYVGYPAACLVLGATIITIKLRIEADDFVKGLFETALEPDEIITRVTGPTVALSLPARDRRSPFGVTGANNDPNVDYPAACLGLGANHHHHQAAHRGRRFHQGSVRDRARARRDRRQGDGDQRSPFALLARDQRSPFTFTSHAYAPCGGSDLRVGLGTASSLEPLSHCEVPNLKPSASPL